MSMMAQTLPPIPRTGSSPQQPDVPDEAPPLASAPQEEPQAGNPAADKAQTIMRQMMDMRRQMEALASQYPPASKDLRTAAESMKQAMLKIVREVQQQPGSNPTPPVGPG